MKLQPDRPEGLNIIHAYDRVSVTVNGIVYRHSIIVPARADVLAWQVQDVDALTPEHFDAVLAFEPEVVLFGSGSSLRFVSATLHRGLIRRGIGLETMDTPAACRTYNILAAEHRRVVALLLLGSGQGRGAPA